MSSDPRALDVDPNELTGRDVVGAGGERLGRVVAVYTTVGTAAPRWAAVHLSAEVSDALVPLADAELDGDTLQVPYSRELVERSPRVGGGGHVSGNHEAELAAHYGVSYRTSESETGFPTVGLPPATNPGTRS